MPRSFDLKLEWKDRRVVARGILGLLVAANVAAVLLVLRPWGGSAEDLARQTEERRRQVTQQAQRLERTKELVSKVEQARAEGDKFLSAYTMNRRSAFSTLIAEVDKMAVESGMQPRESSWVLDPVEGNEALGQLTISVNYEGSYANLTRFVNLLDKSPRFLIVESMQAAPQASGVLNVNIKLDTFIREASGGTS